MRKSKSSPLLPDLEKKDESSTSAFSSPSVRASFSNLQENLEALASVAESSLQHLPKPPPKVLSIWNEFRDFAFQGSVVDLSVGIILGGAFGSVVNSLVNDIIMPPIGWLLSGVDFANIFLLLKRGKKNKITKGVYKSLSQAKDDGAVTVNIGVFLNSVLNFVVISVIIFTFVRTINRIRKNNEGMDSESAKLKKKCNFCYSKLDIRATKCAHCTSELPKSKPILRASSVSISEMETQQVTEDMFHSNMMTEAEFMNNELTIDDEKKKEGKTASKYLKKNLKKQFSKSTILFQ